MEKIEIEKGVPVAEVSVRVSRKYPFSEMQKVGDSFFVHGETSEAVSKALSSVTNAARRFSKGIGIKFSVKKVTEASASDGRIKNGVRCWRVA
jgi:hypothetical protein